jgi:colanic acid/amylovoran biosynthesis glycosyltransferase
LSCLSPDPNGRSEPLGVIVNYQSWLLLTENWIHTQVRCLPPTVTPHVVCGKLLDRSSFPVEHLHCYADLSRLERIRVLMRGSLRLGFSLGRRTALLADVAQRYGARVVHSQFGHTGYHSARAVRRLGLAHVVTFYGADMSALPLTDPRWYQRYAIMFRLVDRVLCEGPRMADQIHKLGCPKDKLRIHHLGVDLKSLPFHPRTWQPGTPLRVLIAASFREKKGIPLAIQALARIATEVPVQVTVIGDARTDQKTQAEKRRILETIAQSGIAERVRLLGYQPHSILLEEAYRHHLFLSPSVTASDGDTEGGAPVSMIEMAATGMPVVSSRHADIPEVIEDGIGGLLADEGDVDMLAAYLRRLVAQPNQWSGFCAAARSRVEREFDACRQGKRLAAIYEGVL